MRIENAGTPDPGLTPVDATGLFLLPALIDSHTHIVVRPTNTAFIMSAYLDSGVTTAADVGSHLDDILALRNSINAFPQTGPRILTAGPMFSAPASHPIATFPGLDPVTTMRLEGSPLTDIDNLQNVRFVIKEGKTLRKARRFASFD